MVVIELHDKQTVWVTEAVGSQVDAAWASHKPVKLPDGTSLATSAIKGIWPQEIWYEMHPEDRVVDEPVLDKPLLETIKPSKDQEVWWEVLKRNRMLLSQGQLPKWKVKDGEIVEAEEGYFYGSPKPTIDFKWVKQKVSDRRWATFYSQSPGYKLLEKLDGGAIVAFKWVTSNGVPPNHLEECSDLEVTKLEKAQN